MKQRTIVILRLDLQGFLWRALLGQALPDLESHHLSIRSAQDGKPCDTKLCGEFPELLNQLSQIERGGALINLLFVTQLERHSASLLSLADKDDGVALFIHSRDSELIGKGIGRELVSRSRAYEASPVPPGREPSEKQQAWLDLLVKLGIERPTCTLASLAHDFMGKISSLQLVLHSMERPNGSRLFSELRKSMGGRNDDVDIFFQDLKHAYGELEGQLEIRLKTANVSKEDREKLEIWSEKTYDLMCKLEYLSEGDKSAGTSIENDFIVMRRSLNTAGSVRL